MARDAQDVDEIIESHIVNESRWSGLMLPRVHQCFELRAPNSEAAVASAS